MSKLPKCDEVFAIFEQAAGRIPAPGDVDEVRSLSVVDLTVFLIFEFDNTGNPYGWLRGPKGVFTHETIEALERVGAFESANLLRRALLEVFPDGALPEDGDLRFAICDSLSPEKVKSVEDLSDRYNSENGHLFELVELFWRANQDETRALSPSN